jgi:hypothetical protein
MLADACVLCDHINALHAHRHIPRQNDATAVQRAHCVPHTIIHTRAHYQVCTRHVCVHYDGQYLQCPMKRVGE